MTSISSLNLDKIAFSKQKTKQTNKFLTVYYDKEPFIVKLPPMNLAFGIQKNTYYEKTQYNFDLSFRNNTETRNILENLDDYIINKVHLEHFQDCTLEEVKEKYISCVKYPSNPSYSPTLKLKIITKDGEIDCDMFYSELDETTGKPKRIDVKENGGEDFIFALLCKQKKVQTAIQCIGLWFKDGKFGLSFKALQVKVFPDEKKEREAICFLSDTETSDSDADFLD